MPKLRPHQERVARLPWVTYLTEGQPCTALRSHAPLKAMYEMGGRPPDPGPYRCKATAHWRFRPLKRSLARPGTYCWTHLVTRGLQGDDTERERTCKALEATA